MKGKLVGVDAIAKLVIIPLVIAYIVSVYPAVLNIQFTAVPVGPRTFLVTGTVEMQRYSDIWTDPDNFDWFEQWWASEDGRQKFNEDSMGLLKLHSILWKIVEEKENSDVLEFTAVIEVCPSATKNWKPIWKPLVPIPHYSP